MASTMVEPTHTIASTSQRPISSMPSTKTQTPAGGRPKISRSATVCNKSPSKKSQTSPGRGLTIRIEPDMPALSMQSIKSAPAKTIRRLPPLPGPPLLSNDSISIPPHTAPTDHGSGAAKAFRRVRPLPCLPTVPTTPISTPHRTPIRHSSPGYKPLEPSSPGSPTLNHLPDPTSNQKAEGDGQLTREETRIRSHRQTLPNPPRRKETPPPMPPLPPMVNKKIKNKLRDTGVEDDDDDDDDERISPISDIDIEEGVIQLGNHIVLRTASTINLRLEPMHSDDEEEKVPPLPPLPLFIPKVMPKRKEAEEQEQDEHVDYTWMLSNRTLYRQQSSQFQSKWVRERKGKRYTEQDYENIIQALRCI